jgi:hypothetical protein
VTPQGDARLDRLQEMFSQLSVSDPWPEHLSEPEQDAWMNRVGADGDLAGLISSAIHGARFHPAELRPYREASERFGSCLDAESVAEAYRLLAER